MTARDQWVESVFGRSPAGGGAADRGTGELKGLAATWEGVEAQVLADIGTLGDMIAELYEDEDKDKAAQVEKAYAAHVRGIFDRFDGTLTGQLKAIAACKTQAEAGQHKAALRKSADDCLAYVAADRVIAVIDGNPMMSLSIAKTCTGVLQQIVASLGKA